MKASLARLGLAMAGIIAATDTPRLFQSQANFIGGRSRVKGTAKPSGNKLVRMAREQRVAVKHGGMRVDHVDAIRFRQIHK